MWLAMIILVFVRSVVMTLWVLRQVPVSKGRLAKGLLALRPPYRLLIRVNWGSRLLLSMDVIPIARFPLVVTLWTVRVSVIGLRLLVPSMIPTFPLKIAGRIRLTRRRNACVQLALRPTPRWVSSNTASLVS